MKIASLLRCATLMAACLAGSGAFGQITSGLIVHLPFDNNYNNTRGNGVNGTAVGSPTFVAGKIGAGAVSLTTLMDGSSFNYVTLGSSPLLDFGSVSAGTATDFTIAFWCNYTNQVDDPPFISNKDWNSSGNTGWGIFTQGGGNFRVNTTDNAGVKQDTSSTPVLRDGKWHHVVVSFARQSVATIYVDGVQATTSSLSPVLGSIDTDNLGLAVNIGQDGTGSYTDHGGAQMINVLMDDLGIWQRVLSAGEVTAIYNAGLGGTNLASVPAIVDPYVKSTTPAKGDTGVGPLSLVKVVLTDGLNAVDTNSVQLIVDGSIVPIKIAKTNIDTTITYTPTNLLASGANTATIVYANNAASKSFFTNTWAFTTAPYVTLTPDLAVIADTNKPGFLWNIFANSAVTLASNNRAEAALAGLLVDSSGNPLPNLADTNSPGVAINSPGPANPSNAPVTFEISSVINLNGFGGGVAGNFPNDDQMPGVPAADLSNDGISAEVLTFLDLPAGLVTMGVNSDDGFRTTAGKVPQDQLGAILAGEFEGSRGPSDTIFYVNVKQAGVYAFRTVYQNATGGAALEWFTVKPDGTKVLINDTGNGGIPAYRAAATTTPPYVKYVSPAPSKRQFNQSSSSLTIVLSDGNTTIDDSSVQLSLDGNAITSPKTRQGSTITMTYAPATVEFPEDVHQGHLTFRDSKGTNSDRTWTFLNFKNVVLPPPVIFDNFDSYAEGGIPTGWSQTNYTDSVNTNPPDINDLTSDAYLGWVVVSDTRLQALKSRIFNVAPNQTSNGVPVTSLGSGNMLYAESDTRDGNQVQFLYSKAYDLSKVTNAAIAFSSYYEQNQDSMGAVEYSIDGGKNWLPVVYYLDFVDSGGDIKVNPDGSVDAVLTFTGPNGDTALWTVNGVPKGGNYGDGIAAPITQTLGRFIAPRANDNPVEGKRLEIYRLEQAGGQTDVRLRFAQLGTGSWYFGVDNLGFYDVPTPPPTQGTGSTPVVALVKATAGSLTLSWVGTGTLQEAPSVLGPWTSSANQSNPQTITAGPGQKFYRISTP